MDWTGLQTSIEQKKNSYFMNEIQKSLKMNIYYFTCTSESESV